MKRITARVRHGRRQDLPADVVLEKAQALADYATAQIKLGEPVTLQELSVLLERIALRTSPTS